MTTLIPDHFCATTSQFHATFWFDRFAVRLACVILPLTLVAQPAAKLPQEVTVNVPLEVPIISGSKEVGKMKLPAGRTFPLRGADAATATIDASGSPMQIPIADTDLTARIEALANQPAAQPQAPPAPRIVSTPTPRPTATPKPTIVNKVAQELGGKLVSLQGGKLVPFDSAALVPKKYLVIYYSASWCGPCRQFTPNLVRWYQRNKTRSDQFDVVFVTGDKTEEDMLRYMVNDKMAWPALNFEATKNYNILFSFGGNFIPRLVVVDENGKVVAHSEPPDGEKVGVEKVLKELDRILNAKGV